MSISSTGIYDNNSELVEDVIQLKIDVDQLQLDFLNTAAGAVKFESYYSRDRQYNKPNKYIYITI